MIIGMTGKEIITDEKISGAENEIRIGREVVKRIERCLDSSIRDLNKILSAIIKMDIKRVSRKTMKRIDSVTRRFMGTVNMMVRTAQT